jgi:hypothetical protein
VRSIQRHAIIQATADVVARSVSENKNTLLVGRLRRRETAII